MRRNDNERWARISEFRNCSLLPKGEGVFPEDFEMFCPKCATQNVDGASFCRSCGANISLIPRALSGQLLAATVDDDRGDWRDDLRKRRRNRPPSIDAGIRNLVGGITFIVV